MNLNVYGVRVKIVGDEPSTPALDWLAKDFSFFVDDGTRGAPDIGGPSALQPMNIHLNLRLTPHFETPRLPFFFKNRRVRVYGWRSKRFCDYGEGTCSFSSLEPGVRRFEISSATIEELYETAYTALLSSIGEALDGRGFHRVHGLAIQYGSKTALLPLPSGGGKSAMATLLSRDPRIKIFGDETPLLRGGLLYPYPLRIALHPPVATALGYRPEEHRMLHRKIFPAKILLDLPPKQIPEPSAVTHFFVGHLKNKRTSPTAPPFVSKGSRTSSLSSLGHSMVIGLGVPQMAEHMLRADEVFNLTRMAFSRLREARRVVRTTLNFNFTAGPDPQANVKALLDFLE